MMKIIVFDSLQIESVDQLHSELARRLEFPDHYGGNLDALYDCLSGEIELPLRIIWKNYPITLLKLGKAAVNVLNVMRDFAQEEPNFTIEVE